ncbi:MAG: AraC family transcriptional regulator [Bacteroidota bacterium]|nr:AraC family transcriptional regulator [Bacteroidota bacterium]
MRLFFRNMVSNQCKLHVKSELEKLGFHVTEVDLCEVEIDGSLSEEQINLLNSGLKKSGIALIDDRKSILIEKIKTVIIELIHYSEKQIKTNFSIYLSEKLHYDYTYLANLFSENQGISIERFLLTHRIEKAKELLVYDELNISEIAERLHYCSVGHLSNQFRKVTGLAPSQYKHLKNKKRNPLESL